MSLHARAATRTAILLLCAFRISSQAWGLGAAFPIGRLPSIEEWGEHPAIQFLVDAKFFEKISLSKPYSGGPAGCAQSFASFQIKGPTTLVAPVAGRISGIDYCRTDRGRDWYGINLRFARQGTAFVDLVIEVRPEGKRTCSEGRERFDNGLFASWIPVKDGDTVAPGAALTHWEVPAAEVRFFLRESEGGRTACPNLFATNIPRSLAHSSNPSCAAGKTLGAFCANPPAGAEWVHPSLNSRQ